MEAHGDLEYDFYFGVKEEEASQAPTDRLAAAVSNASDSVNRVFMTNIDRIETWQDNFEQQQNKFHNIITEMQLMVAQQARHIDFLNASVVEMEPRTDAE